MARVETYGRNRVQRQMPDTTPQRAADYGPGLGGALDAAGRGLGFVAEKIDEVEEVNARAEANEAVVAWSEQARALGNNVKQTLGMGATAAAEQNGAELDKMTSELLGKASPRAQLLLKSELGGKSVALRDSWLDHGFAQKVQAFGDTAKAKRSATLDLALDEDDEAKAQAILGTAGESLREEARFFGRDDTWVAAEEKALASSFFKSRTVKIAASGNPRQALEYATAHRGAMLDDDYTDILSAYGTRAQEQAATEMLFNGQSEPTPAVTDGEPDPDTGQTRKLDPVAFFDQFIAPHEGAAYVIDSNGRGAKYGINEQYNPGVDVRNLTKAQAAEIFRKKYFIKSGADKLPPALAAVHSDTFYLNEKEATKMLKQSGGDVDKYIELRKAFLARLVADPSGRWARYKNGWERRTNELANYANRQGGAGRGPAINITADTNLAPTEEAIMARTDISYVMKKTMIDALKGRRADLAQERSIARAAAADRLSEAMLGLGDGFTDTSQLPQDAWVAADPQTRVAIQNQAKGNRENKPLKPEDAAYIQFMELAYPRKFASKEFRDELIRRGVPLATVRQVGARQGQIAGQLASAKPDFIASGTLWTIAKPAFEASGVYLDSLQTGEKDKKGRAKEVQEDAQQKLQAMDFLRDMGNRWAIANPGKQPPEEEMRRWVGYALRNTSRGHGFTLDTREFYDRIPQQERRDIMTEFIRFDPAWRRKPLASQMEDVVNVAKQRMATGRR